MKIFELNQRVFVWMCVCPEYEGTKFRYKVLHLLSSAFIAMILLFVGTVSTQYFIQNLNTNLANTFFGLYQLTFTFSAFYMLIVAYFFRNSLLNILEKFRRVCDTCKLPRQTIKILYRISFQIPIKGMIQEVLFKKRVKQVK